MRGKVAALAALLTLSLVQPASAASEWVPCGPDAECTKINVPLDYNHPNGQQITLAFNRHRADPAYRKGVLFMAPGVGYDFVLTGVRTGLFAKFSNLLRDFDIIGVDIRGGGLHPFYGRLPAPFRSDAINCGLPVHDPSLSSTADLVRYNQAFAASCASPLLDHMDSVTQAKDLDAIRSSLGEDKVSFFYYGYTGAGQAYASLFPQHVRAMAMDSPLDHSVPVVARAVTYASTVEREFNRFVAWCDASTRCVLHGQDVGALYDNMLRAADQTPVRLDLPPEPGRPEPQQTTVAVRGDDLAFMTEQELEIGDLTLPGSDTGWADLALAIQQVTTGGPTWMFAAIYRYSWGYRDLWDPIRAETCQDYPATVNDLVAAGRIVGQVAPHTRGASQAWDALSGCVGWPAAGTNPPRPTIVRGAPPILIVGAQGNPWSPYENLKVVSAEIQGSVLLTYAGDAHITFLSSQCAVDHMQAYLDELVTPPKGTVCPAIPTP